LTRSSAALAHRCSRDGAARRGQGKEMNGARVL
jgi:hypothetical protein